MDWPETNRPINKFFGPNKVQLKENSLLPVIQQEPQSGWDTVFTCHDLHELTIYYRLESSERRTLNLFITCGTRGLHPWLWILKGTTTGWIRTLKQRYYRVSGSCMTWTLNPKSWITSAENASTNNFRGLCHDNFLRRILLQIEMIVLKSYYTGKFLKGQRHYLKTLA